MRASLHLLCSALFLAQYTALANTPDPSPLPDIKISNGAIVASVDPEDLKDFEKYSPKIQNLISMALSLTKQNLTYKYGSADPAQGGMDCSGTIYFILREAGFQDVPRTASAQYLWARKAGTFESVVSRSMDSFEMKKLQPGDLLFWTGTYITDVDPPVTHSMIYLGNRKSDGNPIMFGASDGRTFDGNKMRGVSVFDFRLPRVSARPLQGMPPIPTANFIGYAKIPGS